MFIKIFFGKIDSAKVFENGTTISFWGSERFFSMLSSPIDWEHGVFQYYCDENDTDFFWWSLNDNFQKGSQENFSEIINKAFEKINEKTFLTELFNSLCISVYDPFDIEDEYSENSFCVEDSNAIDISEFSNYDENSNNLWVFEVTRYENPPVEINGDDFDIMCENNEDDLEMTCRFTFCIDKN